MRIIGCDLHAAQQTIAMLDRDTGEVVERTLPHEGEAVREFYASIPRPAVVGIEATGSMAWFLLSPTTPTPVIPAPAPVATTFALTGSVTESAPSSNVPLAGARVTVMDGKNAGKSATTDGGGNFRLEGLSGGMTLRSSMDGFQDVERTVSMDQNRTLSFPLRPNPTNLTEDYTGNISGGDATTC
jgi:hypothetical protein